MKQKRRFFSKKVVIPGLIVLLLAAGGGIYYYLNNKDSASTTTDGETINYQPPTDEEKQQAEDNKKTIEDQQAAIDKNTPPANQKRQVTPTITSANQSTVNAYVSGVFEEGGTCTATFTSGSTSFTKTSSGFGNASYTQCEPIRLTSGDFSKGGTWSVKVSYSSSTAEGSSGSVNFEVNK